MRSTFLWTMLVLVPLSPAVAQRADSMSPRADSLRHRIEERFASRVKEQLGLTDDQAARLRVTSQEFNTRRRDLAARGRQIRDAMAAQLRPGMAANQDSVARLTEALIQLRLSEVQVTRDELKEQAKYLNPVQRARLYTMREHFAHRIREVHEHRRDHGGMGRRRVKDKPWL